MHVIHQGDDTISNPIALIMTVFFQVISSHHIFKGFDLTNFPQMFKYMILAVQAK